MFRCCFAKDGGETTRLYFARAVSLFRSLTLLFGGVLHDVVVVVFWTTKQTTSRLFCYSCQSQIEVELLASYSFINIVRQVCVKTKRDGLEYDIASSTPIEPTLNG